MLEYEFPLRNRDCTTVKPCDACDDDERSPRCPSAEWRRLRSIHVLAVVRRSRSKSIATSTGTMPPRYSNIMALCDEAMMISMLRLPLP
jgi:hypothetical protein